MANALTIPDGDALPDRALLYAESCFETFRVIDGAILGEERHWHRLLAGMASFGIELDEVQLRALFAEAKSRAARMAPDMLVRLTVGGGHATWGVQPPVDRQCEAIIHLLPPPQRTAPMIAQSMAWPFSLEHKNAKFPADYARLLQAMQQWRQLGIWLPGAEPILHRDGYLISAATANLLIKRDGHWWTPQGKGVLPGVVRSLLLESGAVRASACPQRWLAEAEALAICNSGLFLRPLASLDGRELATTELSELWKILHAFAGVGR